jgi:heavy metal sensor kinase
MITSIRARLTLWHTAVLAVLLALFAVGAYAFVLESSRARTDAALSEAVDDLVSELAQEGRNQPTSRAATEALSDLRFRTIALVMYDSAGRIIASAIPRTLRRGVQEDTESPFDAEQLGRAVKSARITRRKFVSIGNAEGGYRAALEPVRRVDGIFVAAAVQSVHGEAETLGEARLAMLVAIPVTLFLSATGGWLLARRSLAPMVAMRERAARISASNLADRVPIATPHDEVGQLATVINDLLSRLDGAFTQQRQFMADASHELRTPVAIVQNEAGLALSRPQRDPVEDEDAFVVIRNASRRLTRIVDDLFMLARADAGELPVRRDPLYLDEIIADCAREVRSLGEERGVFVVVEPMSEAPYVGDAALLHRLVLNLLDNAIKHSARGARVTVRLRAAAAAFHLEVEDTGPGVPRELQPRIFDRFVRADATRSHEHDTLTSGAGLGLSISRWIAAAHGGTLELARSDARGSLFVLTLPVETHR